MLSQRFCISVCRIHCPHWQSWQHYRPCGYCRKEDPDPDGVQLAATQEPLAEASKLVQTLLQHAQHRPRTHILAFEVNWGSCCRDTREQTLFQHKQLSEAHRRLEMSMGLAESTQDSVYHLAADSALHRLRSDTLAGVACPAHIPQEQNGCVCMNYVKCTLTQSFCPDHSTLPLCQTGCPDTEHLHQGL